MGQNRPPEQQRAVCSATRRSYIFCLKQPNKEVTQLLKCRTWLYPSKSGTDQQFKMCYLSYHRTAHFDLKQIKGSVYRTPQQLSGCGFELVAKADPCGRNFGDCSTQPKPGFSQVGWMENLEALYLPAVLWKPCHYQCTLIVLLYYCAFLSNFQSTKLSNLNFLPHFVRFISADAQ